MHDAYELIPILDKLPLEIESIAAYGGALLVGTKSGTLLIYSVKSTGFGKLDVNLERTHKSFSKKPIVQLCAVEELSLLLSLSDGLISVHTLPDVSPITVLKRSSGATVFDTSLQKLANIHGETQFVLKLCVATRRRLQLYYWKNAERDFRDEQDDLGLPDAPRVIVRSGGGSTICVGFKRDYYLIKLPEGNLKELFPAGSVAPEPLAVGVDAGQLALCRDKSTIVVDGGDGRPVHGYPVVWSDSPVAIAYSAPYLVAVLPRYVEVRTIKPRTMVQSIELPRVKFICHAGENGFYVGSATNVWRLVAEPLPSQLEQLTQNKEFELAVMLCSSWGDSSSSEQQKQLKHIRGLYAFELFCRLEFEQSLKLFADLDTDPHEVIGLYPDLLPSGYRAQLSYPGPVPVLGGVDLENGLLALINYLTQKRKDLQGGGSSQNRVDVTHIVSSVGSTTQLTRKSLKETVDTTLLKCYLETNDALIAPLLRLDNSCHVKECEILLMKRHKYSELVILYENKGLHQKALELLLKQSQSSGGGMDTLLGGPDRTIQYLQRLGPAHLELIFKYAAWVIKAFPKDGLLIFTEDVAEVESLPRPRILEYLEITNSSLVIPYLEHVVLVWNDPDPDMHDALISHYRAKAQQLLADYRKLHPAASPGSHRVGGGHEPGELGVVRSKLLRFLNESKHYRAQSLMKFFPYDDMYEERALLLGRLDRHEDALFIYVNVLQDDDAARLYCTQQRAAGTGDQVYLYLLRHYIKPSDVPQTCRLFVPDDVAKLLKPNIPAAMDVLRTYAPLIDATKAMELLPDDCPLVDVLPFLERVLDCKEQRKRWCQVTKSILHSENLAVEEQRIHYEKANFTVLEENICRQCMMKIGASSFARYPGSGIMVHLYCLKDSGTAPE